jgi:hypothetical protein
MTTYSDTTCMGSEVRSNRTSVKISVVSDVTPCVAMDGFRRDLLPPCSQNTVILKKLESVAG